MEKNVVNLIINDINVQAPKGESVLEAAKLAGIHIPSLCYFSMPGLDILNRPANCRVCIVEQVGGRKGGLIPACATFVSEGMIIYTNSDRALNARRTIVELMLSNHPSDCFMCDRSPTCELLAIASDLGIREIPYEGEKNNFPQDTSSHSILRDPNKCILCRRCETMCKEVQSVGVLSSVNRGFNTSVATAFDGPLSDSTCTFCGQCVAVCPTGALLDRSCSQDVWKALNDPEKFVVVQTAPAVRTALGEALGMPSDEVVTGKMVAALRRMGFDKVIDTNFGADVTVMEESAELVERMRDGGSLPLITSCCPSWIKFIEHQYPDLLDHPSSCKSPQEMVGALAKTYLAEKLGVDPANVVCVSVMPCLSKKYEANNEALKSGQANVDYVISTRELARMIKEACISFADLPNESFDALMGMSTGGADIFGATGGILEGTLRVGYELLTKERLETLEFEDLRGFKGGVKEATIDLGNIKLKVASVNELKNARKLLEDVRNGTSEYHAIEITACPGGCIAGGGQPYHKSNEEILDKRRELLYKEDRNKQLRRSNENPEVKALYDEFLGKPGSEKAHKLLHTKYVKRSV